MDPQVKATMEDTFDEVNTVRHVVDVESPYPNGQPPEGPPRISNNGKIAYATVQFDDQGGTSPSATSAGESHREQGERRRVAGRVRWSRGAVR